MRVLDMGCGRGFCTFEMAKMLEGSGCIVALDLQQNMLNILQSKLNNSELEDVIRLHKCEQNDLGLRGETFDFILLFYMFHEMPEHEAVLQNLKTLLNPDGKILISEPIFHVPKSDFEMTKKLVEQSGFQVIGKPKIFFSRSLLMKKQLKE